MTMATAAPNTGFQLSMLIYDTRYRAISLQLFVLLLVIAAFWWLGSNLQANLEAKGRPLSFDFLWSRAGYDIGQTFIPYTNDSTHFRAMLVGLVNTLVLAVFGCLFATVIGVVVGVLRLSKNWLVSLVMTVYVEIFRNIPLLLWILVIFVPLYEMTPAPNAFKLTDEMIASGTEPAASMILGGTVAITNRGTYIPGFLFERGFSAGWMTTLAIFLVIGGSLAAHLTLNARARRVQEDTGVRPVTWWQSLLVLFVPLGLLLWALGFHLDIPQPPSRFNFEGGVVLQNPFVAMLVALSLYTGAFIAEIVRAGILAVSSGQTEAAYALGLRPNRTMNLVILPQALRVIIPPLISQFLNLTKNTSLGIAASYADLRGTLGGITLNQTGREVEAMLLMMLIYLSISLIISALMNVYNRSVQLKER
ncbi:MAG: amino acid ABC transporter permease [Rhodobacterales bacterium 12-65-15]|nr:MAG: amino acid ABC transporter permease [Rhodobacterales bacterium 12-65-15]